MIEPAVLRVQFIGLLAIIFYTCAFALQMAIVRRGQADNEYIVLVASTIAVLAHGALGWSQMFTDKGVDFGLLTVSSAIFVVVNLIVILSSLRKPLHNLFLLLFPATVVVVGLSLLPRRISHPLAHLTLGISAHVLLSLLAYSLLTTAALQALFLAWQNRQLHRHHPGGVLRALPPLETMETLLFEIVGVGFLLLTLALVTGFMFVDDFMAQHLAHKTLFSLLAWLVYATLLWGRHHLGWRGMRASYWTLGGFTALMLAFWGTKFVLEVVLQRA